MTGKTTAAPIPIGVLGAARIADLAVSPARVTGHRLVAVAARDRRRAEDFAQRHGIERALGTYADVLADTNVEAIYNRSPTPCTARGISPRSRRASTCSPRSPSPATPMRRGSSAMRPPRQR